MRFLRHSFLTCLGALCLPIQAWAQAVQYEMLTLAESAYLYSGLAMQALLRNSSLKQLPQVIVVCCTMWLVYRRVTSPRPQPIAGIIAYVVSCTLILVLFWPEAAPRFFGSGGVILERVTAVGITSYIPQQNSMPRINAAQSGMVPTALRGDTQVPRALNLILGAITEMPQVLGRAISPNNLKRPFNRVAPMKEFVDKARTPPTFLKDTLDNVFVPECYLPAIQRLLKDDPDRNLQNIMPWDTDLRGHLAKIRVNRYEGGFYDNVITCWQTYQSLQTKVEQHVSSQITDQGSNMQQVYRDYLDINPRQQARIFIQSELQRQMEAVTAVESPNRVVNAKRALDATSFGLGVITNFDVDAPLKSFGTQIEKYLDRMARLLGVGSFLVYWGPYLVGVAMFTTLAFFPVVLLWSLFPGQHFKPLVNYFLVLIFVCSTPLWWAMVDAAAEVAYAQNPSGGWIGSPVGWTVAYTSYMVVTVIGIVMVPVMQAMLLFGTWRAIGGMWSA